MQMGVRLNYLAGCLAVAGVVGAAAAPAQADGWYISGNIGATSLSKSDVTDTFTGGNGTGKLDFDTGYGLSGAVGTRFGNFRVEGEVSYRNSDTDKLSNFTVNAGSLIFRSAGPVEVNADISSLGFMANAFYDFKNNSKWTPFLMAGIGIAHLNLDIKSVGGAATAYDENDVVVAGQAGAGIAYEFAPGTAVTLSYRYFGTSDPTFNNGTDRLDGEYGSHNFWVGFLRQF